MKTICSMMTQATIIRQHKDIYTYKKTFIHTNTTTLFQRKPNQSFSQRKVTGEYMNNLSRLIGQSDWISNYSKEGPSSTIAANIKIVIHCS